MTGRILLLAACLALATCGPPTLPSGPGTAKVTSKSPEGKYRCENVTGASEPWLVEWDPAAKVRLQSEAGRGILLVRYEGCALEVLYGCSVEGGYDFTPTTRARNTEYINSEDELFAKLPIGALKLAGEFRQGDRWSLDYVLVGTRDTAVRKVERGVLSGRCAGATHFVQSMVVGAYKMGSTADRRLGAEVGVGGAGLGGSTASGAGLIRQDGTYDRCVDSSTATSDPDCQAIVQLHLQPVLEGGAAPSPPPRPAPAPTPPTPSALDTLLDADEEGPPSPAPGLGTKEYRAELEKKWAAVRAAVRNASSERQLELYQAFLTEFPVENPYADRARKEVDRLDAILGKEAAAAAEAARKAAEIEAKRTRAAEIKEAHDRARNTSGSATAKLAAWESFAASYPESDNPYLSTAKREIATLRKQISAADAQAAAAAAKAAAEAKKKAASTTGAAGVEWVTSRPAGVQFTRSEITVSQYQACVNSGKCSKPNDKSDHKNCNWAEGDRGSHPINCIDWNQAKAVCEWLGGRLPTEDEWFKEASAGGTRLFPWGNQQVSCDYAVWGDGNNTDGCGRDSTWPVCSKRKGDSVSGLCDMSGNVWEWTSTAYDAARRVLRGGSWGNVNPDNLRASYRGGGVPTSRNNYVGVRCSRDD